MEGNFQKSWSVYGYNRIDNDFRNNNFHRGRPMFQSGRCTKTNLEQRFEHPANPNIPHTRQLMNENDCPFYLKPRPQPHPGLRFRSLTDSNIRQFEVNGVSRSCNELQSPKSSRLQPFRQLPERIAPILNNIQNTVSQAGPKTEKFLQKGGKKVQKAIQGVRTSINTFSQKFKRTTRRRYHLENTPTRTPSRTPSHSSRVTPGKLYSPFDVNTPRTPHSYMKGPKRLQHGPPRRNMVGNENYALCQTPPPLPPPRVPPVGFNNWLQFNSPSNHPYPRDQREHYRLDNAFPQMHSNVMNQQRRF